MYAYIVFLPLVLILLPVGSGIVLTVAQSVGWSTLDSTFFSIDALSGDAWRWLLQGHMYESLLLALRVAGISALLSTLLGTCIAYILWRLPTRLHLFVYLTRIPLILPHIAVAWLILLCWSESGIISALLYHVGAIDSRAAFPSLLYDGNGTGMIMAYLWKEVPFVIIMVMATLQRLDGRLLETARMLGGSSWQALRTVVVPHCTSTIQLSIAILFFYALGAIEIPLLLGEVFPPMPGMEAYRRYFQMGLDARPPAMALMTLLLLIVIAVTTCATLIQKVWNQLGYSSKKTTYHAILHASPRATAAPKSQREKVSLSHGLVLVALSLFFVMPLGVLILQAFSGVWTWPHLWPEQFSMRTMTWLSTSWQPLLCHMGSSILYSITVTGVCLMVCFMPARVLAFRTFQGQGMVEMLLLTPAVLPIMGFALGLHQYMVHLYLADTFLGVVLALSGVAYPYMLCSLLVGWRSIGSDYADCASNLGASSWRVMLTVELPLLLPAIVAGSSIVFLISFSDYFLVYLVGGGLVPSFTGFLFPLLRSGDSALASLITLLFMLVPLCLFVIVELLVRARHMRSGMH